MIGSWNIRGLNGLPKQRAVKAWISRFSLDLIGLLETKVALPLLRSVVSEVCPSWHFLSNASDSDACRVLVCWDPSIYSISGTVVTPQGVSCQVTRISDGFIFEATFVYGSNDPGVRRQLWDFLRSQASRFHSVPWIVLGDFNAILSSSDRVGGDLSWYGHMEDFGQCVHDAELIRVPFTGLRYTWHNGQADTGTIMRRLDWVFCNSSWFLARPQTISEFLPRDFSDHCAMIVRTGEQRLQVPHSFRFLNFWADHDDFLGIVKRVWVAYVEGNPMYKFTQKMSLLKKELKAKHFRDSSHISSRVLEAKAQWAAAQVALDAHPMSDECSLVERDLSRRYARLCHDEEAFFRQRSRIQWLALGDKNTKFFHRSLVHRQVRNRIHGLKDEDGTFLTDQREMGRLTVRYFQHLFSAPARPSISGASRYFSRRISEDLTPSLVSPISDDEIRQALFSISDDKAPGPDGFTSLFYKRTWDIIGSDFRAAVRYYFSTCAMPRCVNATRIALVPKVESPQSMDDFRPISCCNVLYKCISKVIANRFKAVLPDVIGLSQSAFVRGRQITDAILLTQELMHNYHLEGSPPRCALKVDIRKAFDTVSWDFIILGLRTIGIPDSMIRWIEGCMTSAHFSVALNGDLHGFFPSFRGLRQGDPLSPYLFVLAMEGLDGILREASRDPEFHYHWRCQQTAITHLCFADDLMVFCRADSTSVRLIRSALDSFADLSGLVTNKAKSYVFFSGVSEETRRDLHSIMGFQSGVLPIRYLGVPLITTRLRHSDCTPLIDRILSRIRLWTSACLTYAGRLQLIKSVLFSIQIYWSSMFILPAAIVRRIESILAAFLWKGTSLSPSGAKVAWSSVCYPLREGGLGIKRVKDWNQAALLKRVWRLFADRTSVWTTWVHRVLLRGRSFWHIRIPSSSSWTWRRILLGRSWYRGLLVATIGDGRDTSLWQDYWLPCGPLCDLFPFRVLSSTGLPWDAKVSDIIHDGRWAFPPSSSDLQHIWASITTYPRVDYPDRCLWKGHPSGRFTVHSAWDILRSRRSESSTHHLF